MYFFQVTNRNNREDNRARLPGTHSLNKRYKRKNKSKENVEIQIKKEKYIALFFNRSTEKNLTGTLSLSQ